MGATRPHTSSASVKHAHKWQICIQRKQRQPNTTARKYSAFRAKSAKNRVTLGN